MKKILIILLLFSSNIFAANHYFSTAGSDANSGLTSSLPQQSLTKLNADFAGYASGDSVFFKCGDTWYGTIPISRSNIYIGSYSTGAKPIITGFTTVTGWTNEGAGIYSKIITAAAQTNMVSIDGIQYALGRTPDAGWLTYESFSTTTSITDNGLGATTNWANAEAVIRKTDWTIDRNTITNHTGDVLTYTTLGSSNTPTNNYGYFIQNDLRTVTSYGEWYHNFSTGKFSMFFGALDPATKLVQVATITNLVTNAGFDYITIDNINFTGAINNIFSFSSATDFCNIKNCSISFAGNNGIQLAAGTGSTISSNAISRCNRSGITCDATNASILSNSVTYIANIPGQSFGADGYTGIYVAGTNSLTQYNTIRVIGSTGVALKGPFTGTIKNNFIESACTILDDGGAIYTAGQTVARLIEGNIITNTVGNVSGTTRSNSLCVGIYLDEVANNVTVKGNTVANVPVGGIKLHKANNNIITDNTCYNNGYGIDLLNSSGTNLFSNSIRRNIFFAKTTTQNALRIGSVVNNNSSFGTADSNYYTRPILDSITIITNQPANADVTRTLASWQSFTSQDAHSKKSFKAISNLSEIDFQYNATASPVVYSFAGQSKITVAGTVHNGSYTIPPYSSIILLSNGSFNSGTNDEIVGYQLTQQL